MAILTVMMLALHTQNHGTHVALQTADLCEVGGASPQSVRHKPLLCGQGLF